MPDGSKKLVNTFQTFNGIADFMICDKENNPKPMMDVKTKAGRRDFRDMSRLYLLSMNEWNAENQYLKLDLSLIAYGAIMNFTMKVDAYLKGDEDSFKLKYTLLSGHDTTLRQFMIGVGLWDTKCMKKQFKNPSKELNCPYVPPVASALLLYIVNVNPGAKKRSMNDLKVRLNYNGKYQNLCGLKKNPTGKWDCDLMSFKKKMYASFYLEDEQFWKRCIGEQPYQWKVKKEGKKPTIMDAYTAWQVTTIPYPTNPEAWKRR